MENVFDLVLEKDETIIEIFKPNKFKTYFKSIFSFSQALNIIPGKGFLRSVS